jgi:hypothetical protein
VASFVVLAAAGAFYVPVLLPPRDSSRELENSMVHLVKDRLGAGPVSAMHRLKPEKKIGRAFARPR